MITITIMIENNLGRFHPRVLRPRVLRPRVLRPRVRSPCTNMFFGVQQSILNFKMRKIWLKSTIKTFVNCLCLLLEAMRSSVPNLPVKVLEKNEVSNLNFLIKDFGSAKIAIIFHSSIFYKFIF